MSTSLLLRLFWRTSPMVQLKLGAVPSDMAEAIQTASVEQLDRWLGRVLSAESCGEILRG
jgi:hypothetical protein